MLFVITFALPRSSHRRNTVATEEAMTDVSSKLIEFSLVKSKPNKKNK